MLPSVPPPQIPLDAGEQFTGEWTVPWESVGVASFTRFVLTDKRLVVQCIFTKAGWLAGKKERAMVNLGNWQELLNSNLEDLAEAAFGSQRAGMTSIRPLVIGGKPMVIVNEHNQSVVDAMLPQISHQRTARIQALEDERSTDPPAP